MIGVGLGCKAEARGLKSERRTGMVQKNILAFLILEEI